MDETNVPADGLNSEEVTEPQSGGDDLTVDELLQALQEEREAREKAEELANNYKVRAEKAEKQKPVQKDLPTNAPSSKLEDAAMLILEDKGFTEEDIELARKVASIEGVTLLQATKTKAFELYKKAKDEEAKQQRASIGASRRAQTYEPPKSMEDLSKSREDHMKAWREAVGR